MSTDFQPDAPFDAFGFDDIDPDAPGSRGGGMLPEGGYCVQITEVIVQNERGSTQIECEVVNAKDGSLLGRKHTEYQSWPDGQHAETYNRIKKEQLLAWCYAAKTTNAEEIKARQQARQGFNVGWLDAMLGRKVLVFIKHDSYVDASGNDKTTAKVEGRVWALDNPKGKGIPGCIATAPAAGNGNGSNAKQSQQTAAPEHQTAPQQPTPPAADPFGGLL